MTYNELIEKIRTRGNTFLVKTPAYESGQIFNAINDSIRDITRETKDQEIAPADLSVTAGTSDYTISTAIGTDVGDITLVLTDDSVEVQPTSAQIIEEMRAQDLTDEATGTINTDPPKKYRVWNGIIRFYPTPAETATYTVYYTKKIATAFYTAANGTSTIPIKDDYLNALQYKSLGVLCESIGKEERANYYLARFRDELNEAMGDRSFNDDYNRIVYHDLD